MIGDIMKKRQLRVLFYCWLIATIVVFFISILIGNAFFVEVIIFELLMLIVLIGVWFLIEKTLTCR